MPDMTPPPIRIVRIITRLNVGGPAIHAALLSARLDPRKFCTCLVIGEPDATEGDLADLVQSEHVQVIRIKSLRRAIRPWKDLLAWYRLFRIVWKERPRFIHTHMAKAGALGRLVGMIYNRLGPGRRPGSRVILVHTFHGHVLEGYFPKWMSRLFLFIERWLARRTECLVAVSEAVQRELVALGIGRPDQWRVIPLGLDLAELAKLVLPNGRSPVRFGIVGRLVPIKNQRLFLAAFHRVLGRAGCGAVSGVVVGDGSLRGELQREARQLGVQDHVQFTGWRRDLAVVYEKMDVACLTSWNEGTPVSLIEAMAAGRAVVATDVGGVRDLLTDPGDTPDPIPNGRFHVARRGILVQSGDAEGLTAAFGELVSNAGLRRRLGEAARPHATQKFSAERLVRDISALYEGLILEG